MKKHKEQLRQFFKSHDAEALFGSADPSDEELDEFLGGLTEEEIHECLQEEYGESIKSGGEDVPETDDAPDASVLSMESAQLGLEAQQVDEDSSATAGGDGAKITKVRQHPCRKHSVHTQNRTASQSAGTLLSTAFMPR